MPLFKTKYNDVERAIKAVENGKSINLEKLSPAIKNNETFIIAYAHQNPEWIKQQLMSGNLANIPESLFQDKRLMSLTFDLDFLSKLPDELRDNEKIAKIAMTVNSDSFRYLSERLRQKQDFRQLRINELTEKIEFARKNLLYGEENQRPVRELKRYLYVSSTCNENEKGREDNRSHALFNDGSYRVLNDKEIMKFMAMTDDPNPVISYDPSYECLFYSDNIRRSYSRKEGTLLAENISKFLDESGYAVSLIHSQPPEFLFNTANYYYRRGLNIENFLRNDNWELKEDKKVVNESKFIKAAAEALLSGRKVVVLDEDNKQGNATKLLQAVLFSMPAKLANTFSFSTGVILLEYGKEYGKKLVGDIVVCTDRGLLNKVEQENLYVLDASLVSTKNQPKELDIKAVSAQQPLVKQSEHELY